MNPRKTIIGKRTLKTRASSTLNAHTKLTLQQELSWSAFSTDLTRLRDEGRIEPQQPSGAYAHSQKRYWEVHYEVALIVEGRSIRFEARYPVEDALRPGEQQEVLGVKLVGIAAAFVPGTA